jgi:hypothetical protein
LLRAFGKLCRLFVVQARIQRNHYRFAIHQYTQNSKVVGPGRPGL